MSAPDGFFDFLGLIVALFFMSHISTRFIGSVTNTSKVFLEWGFQWHNRNQRAVPIPEGDGGAALSLEKETDARASRQQELKIEGVKICKSVAGKTLFRLNLTGAAIAIAAFYHYMINAANINFGVNSSPGELLLSPFYTLLVISLLYTLLQTYMLSIEVRKKTGYLGDNFDLFSSVLRNRVICLFSLVPLVFLFCCFLAPWFSIFMLLIPAYCSMLVGSFLSSMIVYVYASEWGQPPRNW